MIKDQASTLIAIHTYYMCLYNNATCVAGYVDIKDENTVSYVN